MEPIPGASIPGIFFKTNTQIYMEGLALIAAILSGIVSLTCLIVFFMMARNISAIARSAKATEKLLNKILADGKPKEKSVFDLLKK